MSINSARMFENRIWRNACPILVSAANRYRVTDETLADLLKLIAGKPLSLEIVLLGTPDESQLSLMLILRAGSLNKYEVEEAINIYSDIIVKRLNDFGADAIILSSDDERIRMLENMFGGMTNSSVCKTAFFASDTETKQHGFYIPGQYMAFYRKPFDWQKIAKALMHYTGSMFSVMLSNARLVPDECRAISENLNYYRNLIANYRARINMAEAEEGKRIFEFWDSIREADLCFTSITCAGNQLFTSEIVPILTGQGFAFRELPDAALSMQSYLYQAPSVIAEHAASKLHFSRPELENTTLGSSIAQRPGVRRLTHLTTIDCAGGLFALPKAETFLSAAKILPVGLQAQGGIFFGYSTFENRRISINADSLTRHGAIVGKPGCGKTTFAMGLLTQLDRAGYPFIAIEPVKQEYRCLAKVNGYTLYTPGNAEVCPLQFNPFIPPKGVTQAEYMPSLLNIFEYAFNMNSPLNLLYPQAIQRCYARHGWLPDSTRDSKDIKVFGFREVAAEFKSIVLSSKYDKESEAGILVSGLNRLLTLVKTAPDIFDTMNTPDYDAMLNSSCVIELDALKNQNQRALVIAIILENLQLVIQRRNKLDGRLKNIIFMDEAHMLLSQDSTMSAESVVDTSKAAVKMIQNMTRVFRAYGIGLFFADQSAFSLTSEVFDQVDLKLVFRTDGVRDCSILAQTIRMTNEQIDTMRSLPTGCCYISSSETDFPVKAMQPNYKEELGLPSAVEDSEFKPSKSKDTIKPYELCTECSRCNECDFNAKSMARRIADLISSEPDLRAAAKNLLDNEGKLEFKEIVPNIIIEYLDKEKERGIISMDEGRLADCVRIHLALDLWTDSATPPLALNEYKALVFSKFGGE